MVKRKQTQPPIPDEVLKLSIEELRRTSDWLSAGYNNVKTKTLTYLGGSLALLTYLYSGGDLFFPDEMYGRIFYVMGLGSVLCAIVMLFLSMLPRRWEFSTDSDDLDDMNFDDVNHYLQYVKNNYMISYKRNIATYEKNHRVLSLSFFPLVIGAIILVVLKIFGA